MAFESFLPFLEEWNKIQNDATKIDEINTKLTELGFKPIDNYDRYAGLACRLKYFQQAGLIHTNGRATPTGKSDYPGAIVDTVTKGATTCKY